MTEKQPDINYNEKRLFISKNIDKLDINDRKDIAQLLIKLNLKDKCSVMSTGTKLNLNSVQDSSIEIIYNAIVHKIEHNKRNK